VIEVAAHSGAVVQQFIRAREAGAGCLVQLACHLEAAKGQLPYSALEEEALLARIGGLQTAAEVSRTQSVSTHLLLPLWAGMHACSPWKVP
jgi:hypothetical protein